MREREPEAGFTLLELVIALAILSVAVGGLVSVLGAALRTTAVDVHRTDAVALATAEMTVVRHLASAATAPPADHTTAVNGQTYAVADVVAWQRSSGGVDRAYRSVRVTVSWTDQGGVHSVAQVSALPGPSLTGAGVGGPCVPPPAPTGPAATPVTSGLSALRVSWTEPNTPGALDHWEIDTSPDATAWTASVVGEQPLAAGATHVVELDGVAPASVYFVRVGAVAGCGATSWSVLPTASTGAPGVGCALGSAGVGPPVAARTTSGSVPGALAGDLEVTIASLGLCPTGLWAGVATSGDAVTAVALQRVGTGPYHASLAATTQPWDLGRHLVKIFPGSPSAGALPTAPPLAVAVLCVEPAGAATC
ncbi:MAG: hypothetical protein NVS1B12_02620 [Acidimicrobiales bacterium]